MRMLVCGGRNFTDHIKFNRELTDIITNGTRQWDEITIIHGAARGADTLAGLYAKMFGIKVEAYPADWDEFGLNAGVIRNQNMLDTGIDLVVAFPGKKGTADMVRRAKKAGVRVIEIGSCQTGESM
jgi:YspA, cpYpsA-related SLOG family